MLRDSFWWPNSPKQGLLFLAVVLMIPLHQSELFGLMDSGVQVFGWLPMQLAYDILFNLVGVVILYAMYRFAPEPPAEFDEEANEASDPETGTGESVGVTADGGQ